MDRKKAKLWLIIGLPVAVAAAALIGFGAAAWQKTNASAEKVREAAARTRLRNNLTMIGFALTAFADDHRGLPPQGFSGDPHVKGSPPLLSWRVALLPYLDQAALYKKFRLDEPWDSPHNLALLASMPDIYALRDASGERNGMTHIQLLTGPDTLYPGPRTRPRFRPDMPENRDELVLVIEAGDPVEWTRPADVAYDAKKPLPKFGALSPSLINVLLGDRSTRTLDLSILTEPTLRQAINPKNREVPFGGDWFH